MSKVDEELLMAYADGELDPETAAEVEDALRDDPEARRQVEKFRQSAWMVRSAFNAPVQEAPPQALVNFLNDAARKRRRWSLSNLLKPFGTALAPALAVTACLAMFVGLGGGFMLAEWRISGIEERLAKASRDTEAIIRETLQQTLETKVSGTTVSWSDGLNDISGTIVPIRTFKNDENKFCREFKLRISRHSDTRASNGIACRERDGSWVMRIHILNGNRDFLDTTFDM